MGAGDRACIPRRPGWAEPADAGRLIDRRAHGGRRLLEQSETRAGLFCLVCSFWRPDSSEPYTALNFLHWFLYWELSLIPAFFLIRMWGGPGRARAATQFFVYTMVGSITLLLAFLAIFLASGSFDFVELTQMAQTGQLAAAIGQNLHWHQWDSNHITMFLFCGAFLGFAVKTPVVPFHGWLASAYSEAAPETTMVLTGALSKMGVYGFLRILLPIFPEQMWRVRTVLLWLAIASIVLPAFTAWAQTDLKRMFAYSSINHLGYCILGIVAVAGSTGARGKPGERKGSGAYRSDAAGVQPRNHRGGSVLVSGAARKTERRAHRARMISAACAARCRYSAG